MRMLQGGGNVDMYPFGVRLMVVLGETNNKTKDAVGMNEVGATRVGASMKIT